VIAGDNEDGKSTLLLALRAALFVKHKISAGVSEELLPFGSKVRPSYAWILSSVVDPIRSTKRSVKAHVQS
jgi:hypothetical protein